MTMRLSELDPAARRALGALVRLVIGTDLEFSEGEQRYLDRLPSDAREAEALWGAIGTSAVHDQSMDAIREIAAAVRDPLAQQTILGVIRGLAAADGLRGPHYVLTRLEALWERPPDQGPMR